MLRCMMITALISLWALKLGANELDLAAQYNQLALTHYHRAIAAFDKAIEERNRQTDPGGQWVKSSIKDLVCLLGISDRCFDLLEKVGQPHQPYMELIKPLDLQDADPGQFHFAWLFAQELMKNEAISPRERILVAETIGVLEQMSGDYYRRAVAKRLFSDFRASLGAARASEGEEAAWKWLKAYRLAWLMLDQEAIQTVTDGMSTWLESTPSTALSLMAKDELGDALLRGTDIVLQLEGLDLEEVVSVSQELSQPTSIELSFQSPLTSSSFKTDLCQTKLQFQMVKGLVRPQTYPVLLFSRLESCAATVFDASTNGRLACVLPQPIRSKESIRQSAAATTPIVSVADR